MSELNQAPQSVEPPSEEFFRTGSTTKAPGSPADQKSSPDGSSSPQGAKKDTNGTGSNGASGSRTASLVTAAKAALAPAKTNSGSNSVGKSSSNGAKVSVAPNVSNPNAVNPKAVHPNPTNPNVSALGAPLPKPNPNPGPSGNAGSQHPQAHKNPPPAQQHQGPSNSAPSGTNVKVAGPPSTGSTGQPSAPVVGQVSHAPGAPAARTVATSAPRPPVPYTAPTGFSGQVRRTVAGAGAAAGAVVSGSVDAVRVASGAQTTTTPISGQSARRTRKARLRLSRLDPWSVMKTSFLFAIAGGIILFVSVWVVWGVINASGAFDSINKAFNDLIANPGAETKFTLESYVNTQKVLGFTALIAAADVVIFTALATLFSFLYNLAATVLGGLEVTLAED